MKVIVTCLSCFIGLSWHTAPQMRLREARRGEQYVHPSSLLPWSSSALTPLLPATSHPGVPGCAGDRNHSGLTQDQTSTNVTIPQKGEAIDPDNQNGSESHMPAEEGGDKYNVVFVIIHPFIARNWFVQHKAYLNQPRACHHIKKGLHHPKLQHIRSPQLCDHHQHQQEYGLSKQDVRLQLHTF